MRQFKHPTAADVHNVQALWGQLMWLWNRPTIQRLRFMFSMANLSVRLPAVMAIIGTQIGLLSTQVLQNLISRMPTCHGV